MWLAKRHWTCSLKRLYRLAAQVEVGFKLEDQHGPAADWIALDPVQRSISKRFRNFLLAFQAETDGARHYLEAILRMCRGALADQVHFVGRPRTRQLSFGNESETMDWRMLEHMLVPLGSQLQLCMVLCRSQQAEPGGELRAPEPGDAHPGGVGGRRAQADVRDLQPRRVRGALVTI